MALGVMVAIYCKAGYDSSSQLASAALTILGSSCPGLKAWVLGLTHGRCPLLPQAPHNDISPSPPVVVPVRIEAAPAFLVAGILQDGVHDRLKVFEEDEVLRPGSAAGIACGADCTCRRLRYALTVCHVIVNPASRVHVEDVCLVEVVGAIFARNIDGWLAGQSPRIDLRMNQVTSPGCAVTWHEETDCSVSHHAIVQLGFVAKIVHHIDDTTLVDGADICCNVDVDSQAEEKKS